MSKTNDPRLAPADAILSKAVATPQEVAQAVAIYAKSAAEGNASAALRSAVFAAEGLGRAGPDWNEAWSLFGRAVENDANAQQQVRVLAGAVNDGRSNPRDLYKRIDIQALLNAAAIERLNGGVMIGVSHGFAPAHFATWIIDAAKDRLEPSTVVSKTGQYKVDPSRPNATVAVFGPLQRDMVVAVLEERAAKLSGMPVRHQETPQVVCYQPGPKFEPRYDAFDAKMLQANPANAAMGQRNGTLLTALNDDFTGGKTEFPKLLLEHRGQTGECLAISNVEMNGQPELNVIYADQAPESGRKWVLVQMLRSRPLVLR